MEDPDAHNRRTPHTAALHEPPNTAEKAGRDGGANGQGEGTTKARQYKKEFIVSSVLCKFVMVINDNKPLSHVI